MRVSKRGDLYIATRIAGATHHFLGLDFSRGIDQYAKDLSGDPSPSQELFEVILDQVGRVFEEQGLSESELSGIQFDGRDTPSESAYTLLAREIIAARRPAMERPPKESRSVTTRLAEHRQR